MTVLQSLLLLTCFTSPQEGPFEKAVWQRVSIPGKASFRGLSLPRPQVIWISGTENTVLRSIDGGTSWRTFKVGPDTPLDFRDIWALDDSRVWVMGAGSGAASCIYSSEDGGNTWREEHTNHLDGAFFDGFVFINDKTGFVYSDPVDGAFMVLQRRDHQWEKLKPAQMPPAQKGEASFAASGTGIAALGRHLWFGSGGAEVARVFRSSDLGKSWSAYPTPLRAGDSASGVFSIAFRDTHHGVIVGGKYNEPENSRGTAATTSDGGKTWKPAQIPPRGFRSCVVYVPGQKSTLVAAGTSGAEYSLDDGKNWRELGELTLNVLKFADDNQAWAVGPDGMVALLKF